MLRCHSLFHCGRSQRNINDVLRSWGSHSRQTAVLPIEAIRRLPAQMRGLPDCPAYHACTTM